MDRAKPCSIPKRWVWDAYKRVKANGGAAGVDDQSIAEFERDLKNNLYRLWNRMSSGSYFPPPVKRVQIGKREGGSRPLGIPTVSDRIAQAVVKSLSGAGVGKTLSPGFIWLPTWKIGIAGCGSSEGALLATRLGA